MKKLISILLAIAVMFVFCAGCSEEKQSNITQTSSIPSFSLPSLTVPSFDFDYEEEDEDEDEHYSVTVYVSKAGKIHRISNCSGMKYYTPMDYDEAVSRGYKLCMNCY